MFKALGLIEAQGLVEKENTSLYISPHQWRDDQGELGSSFSKTEVPTIARSAKMPLTLWPTSQWDSTQSGNKMYLD